MNELVVYFWVKALSVRVRVIRLRRSSKRDEIRRTNRTAGKTELSLLIRFYADMLDTVCCKMLQKIKKKKSHEEAESKIEKKHQIKSNIKKKEKRKKKPTLSFLSVLGESWCIVMEPLMWHSLSASPWSSRKGQLMDGISFSMRATAPISCTPNDTRKPPW